MAIFTLAQIDAQITEWQACLLALSKSQSYTIGNRELSRSDLAEVRKTLEWLDSLRQQLVSGTGPGPRFTAGRPRR